MEVDKTDWSNVFPESPNTLPTLPSNGIGGDLMNPSVCFVQCRSSVLEKGVGAASNRKNVRARVDVRAGSASWYDQINLKDTILTYISRCG